MNKKKDFKEMVSSKKQCAKKDCSNDLQVFCIKKYCDNCMEYIEKVKKFSFYLREIFIQKFIDHDIDSMKDYYNKYAYAEIHDYSEWNNLIRKGWSVDFEDLFADDEIKMRAEKIVKEYCIDWFNIEILDWSFLPSSVKFVEQRWYFKRNIREQIHPQK